MNKAITFILSLLLGGQLAAQFDFDPITDLITDSIGVIGQSGESCGLLIVQGDSVIYERYWGSWDSTTYQPIASGSKMPSMALMMRLIDEGFLSLTDTVQNYLPSFAGKPFMTLHQLMSHTSGLPGQSPYISDNSYTLQQAVDSIGMNTPMTSFSPGTAFQYGGVSMHVAGRLAEITTGMTWDSLFQQKIAIPLGMTNTDYEALGETTNYRIAGGMGTTMPDFSKLLIMLLNDGLFNGVQVIEPETVSIMQSDQTNGVPLISTPYSNDPLRQDFRYGYGVWVEKEFNGETTQFGSQGAFGFTPWIDRCRNIGCVFFVRRTLGIIQPTHTQLRELIEQIIPVQLAQPLITANGNQLQSSYPDGNQWYFNGVLLNGEDGSVLDASISGIYQVSHTSEEGCTVFSEELIHTAVGINETGFPTLWTIHPNPSADLIYANCTEGYELFNAMGQRIAQSTESVHSIGIAELPTGVYYLKSGVHVGRFIRAE
jgi:CubicO group peptidase (beta-lactamase class C family)